MEEGIRQKNKGNSFKSIRISNLRHQEQFTR